MNLERFRNSPAGRLVKGYEYWAFVPNPLPPEFKVDNELSCVLSDADRALGELDSVYLKPASCGKWVSKLVKNYISPRTFCELSVVGNDTFSLKSITNLSFDNFLDQKQYLTAFLRKI